MQRLGSGLEGIVYKISENVVMKKWKVDFKRGIVEKTRLERVKSILDILVTGRYKRYVKTPGYLGREVYEKDITYAITYHEYIPGRALANCNSEIKKIWYELDKKLKLSEYLIDLHDYNVMYHNTTFYIVDCWPKSI